MNQADIISMVTKKTNLDSGIVGKVVAAYEQHAGGSILDKVLGKHNNTADTVAQVAQSSGVSSDICSKVINAIQEVAGGGLSGLKEKIPFLK